MKIPSREAVEAFQGLVSSRRYIYHICTSVRFEKICQCREIRSRNSLGPIDDDYALDSLVRLRAGIRLPDGRFLNDTIPFYFTPRQPMFSRLIREEKARPEEIIAIGFDFENLKSKYRHWLFSTNPAYEGATYLGDWSQRASLHWDVLEKWHWNSDAAPKEEKIRESWKRQAEIVLEAPVSLWDSAHVVVDKKSRLGDSLEWCSCVYEIEGIFEW